MSLDFRQALERIVEYNESGSRVFFTYRDTLISDSYDLEKVGSLFEVVPKAIP